MEEIFTPRNDILQNGPLEEEEEAGGNIAESSSGDENLQEAVENIENGKVQEVEEKRKKEQIEKEKNLSGMKIMK